MLWTGGEEIVSIVAVTNRTMDLPMRKPRPRNRSQRKPNDLSRSLATFDMDRTLIAVIEMSASRWLVAGIVPGVERQPLKKLEPDEHALLIAAAFSGQLFKGGEERFAILWVDPIFHRDQHRTSIMLDLTHDHRLRPMHGRREVNAGCGKDSHLRRRGMGRRRPAEAIKSAPAMPIIPAICPQSALPKDKDPNIIMA